MKLTRQLATALHAALYAAPWVWLICLAVFVTAVTFKVGHFPSYSQPDPKHVDGLAGLYLLTMVLLVLAALSPIVVATQMLWARLRGRAQPIRRRTAAIYLLGVSLSAAVIVGDAFGLCSWLFD
jgi:hypothetical protein